jgi:invasion protein IalB
MTPLRKKGGLVVRKGGNMSRNTSYAIAGGAAAVLIVAVGLYLYLSGPANRGGVPPLPANARMFNNWALIGCQPNANNARCVLVRRAVNQQTRRLIMQMTVTRVPNGAAIMVVTLPPNVAIPNGLTITPMGGTAVKGAIRRCVPQACTAAVALTDTLANEMAATDTTALEFVAANGRNIRMNVNIQGFNQGFAAWLGAVPAPAVVATPAAGGGSQSPAPPAPPAAQPAAKAAPSKAPAPPAPSAPAAKAAPAAAK